MEPLTSDFPEAHRRGARFLGEHADADPIAAWFRFAEALRGVWVPASAAGLQKPALLEDSVEIAEDNTVLQAAPRAVAAKDRPDKEIFYLCNEQTLNEIISESGRGNNLHDLNGVPAMNISMMSGFFSQKG